MVWCEIRLSDRQKSDDAKISRSLRVRGGGWVGWTCYFSASDFSKWQTDRQTDRQGLIKNEWGWGGGGMSTVPQITMLFTGRGGEGGVEGHTASFTHILTSVWPKFHLLSVRYLPDLHFWWTVISRWRSHCNVNPPPHTPLCNLTRVTGCS